MYAMMATKLCVAVSVLAWSAQKALDVHELHNANLLKYKKALSFTVEFCDNEAIMGVLRRHAKSGQTQHGAATDSDDASGRGHAQSTLDECEVAAQTLRIAPLERTVLEAVHDVGLCGHHRCDMAWDALSKHGGTLVYAFALAGVALFWVLMQALRYRYQEREKLPLQPGFPIVAPWFLSPREHALYGGEGRGRATGGGQKAQLPSPLIESNEIAAWAGDGEYENL
jgi:hypothetical protein